MRPEADGWEGEPTSWAEPDSLAQRLSAWTSSRLGGFKQAIAERAAGSFDPGPVDARIAAETAGAAVHMYSFSTCPFCKRAQEVLREQGAEYSLVQLDTEPEGPAIRARLGRLTGRTSMPAIWIGGEYIGGCNDGPRGGITSLERSGELWPMLEKAGALRR
jgi:glutaredoxin